jgi:hypothetical protein
MGKQTEIERKCAHSTGLAESRIQGARKWLEDITQDTTLGTLDVSDQRHAHLNGILSILNINELAIKLNPGFVVILTIIGILHG